MREGERERELVARGHVFSSLLSRCKVKLIERFSNQLFSTCNYDFFCSLAVHDRHDPANLAHAISMERAMASRYTNILCFVTRTRLTMLQIPFYILHCSLLQSSTMHSLHCCSLPPSPSYTTCFASGSAGERARHSITSSSAAQPSIL